MGMTLDDVVPQYESRLKELEKRLSELEGPAPQTGAPGRGAGYTLGIDVGGTFTDLLSIEAKTGLEPPKTPVFTRWMSAPRRMAGE